MPFWRSPVVIPRPFASILDLLHPLLAALVRDRESGQPNAPPKTLPRLLPNPITAARLALVPVVVWAIARESWGTALLLFGLSDGIDGVLARRYALTSRIGAILDPLADKTLTLAGPVPAWFPAVPIARDTLMVVGAGLARLAGRPLETPPLLVGKLNTAGQVAFLAWLLLGVSHITPAALSRSRREPAVVGNFVRRSIAAPSGSRRRGRGPGRCRRLPGCRSPRRRRRASRGGGREGRPPGELAAPVPIRFRFVFGNMIFIPIGIFFIYVE